MLDTLPNLPFDALATYASDMHLILINASLPVDERLFLANHLLGLVDPTGDDLTVHIPAGDTARMMRASSS